MQGLTDEMLIDSYRLAVQLKLEPDFINLLLAEVKRRELRPDDYQIGA